MIDLLNLADDKAELLNALHCLGLRHSAHVRQGDFVSPAADFQNDRLVSAQFHAGFGPLADNRAARQRRLLFFYPRLDAHLLKGLHSLGHGAALEQRNGTGGIGKENFIADIERASDYAQKHQRQRDSKSPVHKFNLRISSTLYLTNPAAKKPSVHSFSGSIRQPSPRRTAPAGSGISAGRMPGQRCSARRTVSSFSSARRLHVE